MIPITNRSTIVAAIYRSPSSSYPEFCSQLSNILNNLVIKNKNIVICCDININIINPDSASCLEYMHCLYSFGFSSHISAPTRNDLLGSSTLIDHIISSISSDHIAGVVDHCITDHNPIFFTLGFKNIKSNNTLTKRQFDCQIGAVNSCTRLDIGDQGGLRRKGFCVFLGNNSYVNRKLHHLHTVTKWFRSPRNAWISNSLLKAINKKNNLHKKLKSLPFNLALKSRFQKYSATLSSLLRRAKRNYYQDLIVKNASNTTRCWKIVKEFLNKNVCSETTIKIANTFSEHFCTSMDT